jgi:hypothetical protein
MRNLLHILLRVLPRWSIIVFLVLVLASAGVALAAPASQLGASAASAGLDPLSPDEQARALAGAAALRSVSAAAVRTAQADPGQVAVTAPAEELVLLERHQESKDVMAAGAWARRADLFLYRYADDTLVHGLYDYATGQTTVIEEVQGVQLPLSDGERATAIALAFADTPLHAQMADEYRLITGNALTSAAQLDFRVFNYHAGSNPEMETPAVQACAINRCAQLLILTDQNVTLRALPIVNLSTMRVVSVLPFDVGQPSDVQNGHTHSEGGN